jgi:hypothetical protein
MNAPTTIGLGPTEAPDRATFFVFSEPSSAFRAPWLTVLIGTP